MVVGSLGTVLNGLIKGLEDLEVRGQVENLQITVLLSSARTLKKILGT